MFINHYVFIYEVYIEGLKDKYIICFALGSIFGEDENYIDRNGEDYNVYNELYIYKNSKIIKDENNLYNEIINKLKDSDETIVLDEWSFLEKFYDSNKFMDEYIKHNTI